jgi:antitoxin component YwqK of YwqJK toxin-antitoxin module
MRYSSIILLPLEKLCLILEHGDRKFGSPRGSAFMFWEKHVKKLFKVELKVVFFICLAVIFSFDFLKAHVKPQIIQFVNTHSSFLINLSLVIFLICSFLLTCIAWWVFWGEKRKDSPISKYISQLVCENYYGDYKRINVYRAIKTSLSKFSRDSFDADESKGDRQPRAPRRKFYKDGKPVTRANLQKKPVLPPVTEETTDGVHKTFFKNGKLEREVTYKNNVLDGDYRTYYENGRVHQEKHYKDGKLNGVFKAYDEENVLYFENNYKDDKQDGISNKYYMNGILQYRDTYKDGNIIRRESYSESGELMFRHDYEENNPA